ncbi:MAG: hypothetical protein VX278_00220, partial [Myxococcota bacterium]|nr:hypothetical protein [Myxococcota bacterium]
MSISDHIYDHACTDYPLPIAETVVSLAAADNEHEERDRIVECFRAIIRTLSVLALAAVVGRGSDADIEKNEQLQNLIAQMGRGKKGLTDGQWVALTRESLRGWKNRPQDHPLPELVELFFKDKKTNSLIDQLLKMRKSETVAHGASGDQTSLQEIISTRLPQLETLLTKCESLWSRIQFVVPLGQPMDGEERQRAWSLKGPSARKGRWRRLDLDKGIRLEPGRMVLIDKENRDVLHLYPMALFQRPTPEAIEEFFVLEGRSKSGSRHLSIPAMLEVETEEAWTLLEEVFLTQREAAIEPGLEGIESPFLGLQSFSTAHAPLFFGRDTESQELANRIRLHSFVVLTGPSGSGKSSLLMAGVIPKLRNTRTAILRPANRPMQSLKYALQESFPTKKEEIEAQLKHPKSLLLPLLSDLKEEERLLIMVDQAEELLTLCKDGEEQTLFATILSTLSESDRIYVLCSLREDFFGPMALVPGWKSTFSRQVVVIGTPSADILPAVLIEPLRKFGYAFEDFETLQLMIKEVDGALSALPLLQFCAAKMWERRDRSRKVLTQKSL